MPIYKVDTIGNITRRRYGKLIATGETRSRSKTDRTVEWELLCNCGNRIWLSKLELRNLMKPYPYIEPNCGCWTKIYLDRQVKKAQQDHTHRLHAVYEDMFQRIIDPSHELYRNKGKNHTVCDEWSDPEHGYERFVEWSYWHGGFLEQPEDTPAEALVTVVSKRRGRYAPDTCYYRVVKPWTTVTDPFKQLRIVFDGIVYTKEEFQTLLCIDEHLIEKLVDGNVNLNPVIWNFMHPDDPVDLEQSTEGSVVDKNGFIRIIPDYQVEFYWEDVHDARKIKQKKPYDLD